MTTKTPRETAHVTDHDERLPMPADQLEELAAYYDEHDTSADMDDDLEWVDPRPMVSTSLRLPRELRDTLKEQARAAGERYTAYVRHVLEIAAATSRIEDDSGGSSAHASTGTGKSLTIAQLARRVEHLEHRMDEQNSSPGA